MPVAAYRPKKFSLLADDGSVLADLRGLTPTDIHALVNYHKGDLIKLWDLIESGMPSDSVGTETLMMGLMAEMPGLMANIIALAADEPEAALTIQAYPIMLQVRALREISDLTFTEGFSVKKLMEVVAALLQKKNALQTAIMKIQGNTG